MLEIFVTNLSKYNAGELVGKWLSLPMDEEELTAALEEIGGEEQFISDYETSLDLRIGEHEDVFALNEQAQEFEDLEDWEQDIVQAYLEAFGGDLQGALNKYDDCTFYPGMSLIDVAYEIVEDCYDLPEVAQRYFDYDAFARDLGYDGYVEVSNGVICAN
ncbi:MAG: hypothetical protein DBY32_11400 [Phascolarctobacterium sp.]|nr:MAG: hypothetical protein DBY32_11400 [Phascolarctobacterium sp.]